MIHLVAISETVEVLVTSIWARSPTTLCTSEPSVSYILSVCSGLATIGRLRSGFDRLHPLR
jgi:hypothetical protein